MKQQNIYETSNEEYLVKMQGHKSGKYVLALKIELANICAANMQ